jgi:hypothetical protein
MALPSHFESTFAFLVVCLPSMRRLVSPLLKRVGLLPDPSKHTPVPVAHNRALPRSWWHISGDSNDSLRVHQAPTTPGSAYINECEEKDEVVEIQRDESRNPA